MLDLKLLAASKQLQLLPPDALLHTGELDHADWNYRPVLGAIQRLRFTLVKSLLPEERVQRLLELGYGSGVFLTELARHCAELFGIDVHPCNQEIMRLLSRYGVRAQLHRLFQQWSRLRLLPQIIQQ